MDIYFFLLTQCLTCEDDWDLHGGNCYHFSNNKSTWTESRRSCQDQGGDLVKIDSREKQVLNTSNDGDTFWIGLTDSEKEGSWVWGDGSPLDRWSDCSQNIWGGGTTPEVDCVRMKKIEKSFMWFDTFCNERVRSICEKTAETQPCL
uniref:C-type lectin domain-containing protein n=1 Tax=Cyprinodon variegatus TaxID=28743 RepID=A0A3Q2DT74_CYPVA